MFDSEILGACCGIHTKEINILCKNNIGYFKHKFSGICRVTYWLQWIHGYINHLYECN